MDQFGQFPEEAMMEEQMEKQVIEVEKIIAEHKRLREAIQTFLDSSATEQDANGWVEITVYQDEFQLLRQALKQGTSE